MIPVIGIPILNRGDLLIRLFNSIDYPVNTVHILVNYTERLPDTRVLAALEQIQNPTIPHPFINHIVVEFGELLDDNKNIISHNMGVAGSWNRILKTYPDASYIMLVGNDIQFTSGDLEKFDTTVKNLPDRNKVGIVYGNQDYSCFAILPETVKTVGYFDENIYPAYLEDCDYSWRCKLEKLKEYDLEESTHMIHGESPNWGSSTIYSNPDYYTKNGTTHALNFVYYRGKWGGNNGEEIFMHPFNDSKNPSSYWTIKRTIITW